MHDDRTALDPAEEWAHQYPEGRTLYYEGDDPARFVELCQKAGFVVSVTVRVDRFSAHEAITRNFPVGT